VAIDIAAMVSDWEFSPGQVLCQAGVETPILTPNPRRYGFGVASPLTANLFLRPLGTTVSGPGIYFGLGGWKWFDFHKHASLVSAGWQVQNSDGVQWAVSVWEVVQSPTAGQE